jgi:hypothetical protein
LMTFLILFSLLLLLLLLMLSYKFGEK